MVRIMVRRLDWPVTVKLTISKDGFEKLLTVSVEEGVKFSRQRFAKTHPNLAKVRADTYDRSKIFSQFPQ